MIYQLAQLGFGGNDLLSQILNIVYFVGFIAFILFYQRIVLTQTILKLEKDTTDLEAMANKAEGYVVRTISKKPDKKMRDSIKNFMEFFAVPPVETDPYGIMKKLDHVIKNSDERFKYFVNQIAPKAHYELKQDIKNALAGAMTAHQIAKIVRHFLELIKKYKMIQLALILQMQIPFIVRIAKASVKATYAFSKGIPVGDGIGSLVVANLMTKKVKVFREYEFAVTETRIAGKKVFISKAEGPGASTGYPGKFMQNFMKRNKFDRIITVDAALKLEGEKTGTVAEGVGVAMGGSGVDRYEIEEIAVKMNMPLDAIAIKVSDEEALMPMKKEIWDSTKQAIEVLNETVKRGKKNERILIIGVGNTCGIGNDLKSVSFAEERLKRHMKLAEETEEKKKGILKF